MEFTRDEIACICATLERNLYRDRKEDAEILEHDGIDYRTPVYTLYSNLLHAHDNGDKILHIGIRD